MHAGRIESTTSRRAHAERGGSRHTVGSRCAAVGLLIASLMLSGCTFTREYIRNGFKVGPNYETPPAAVAPQWIEHDEPRVGTEASDLSTWWTVFNDPVLNTLIEDAYQQNLDLKIAAAHILEATAQRNVAVGNLLPQSQKAFGAYAHVQIPTRSFGLPFTAPSNVWVPGFNASWELDFWGRYRRAVEGRSATLEANARGLQQRARHALWRGGDQLRQSSPGPTAARALATECRDPEGGARGFRSPVQERSHDRARRAAGSSQRGPDGILDAPLASHSAATD